MEFCNQAWAAISDKTIQNCFGETKLIANISMTSSDPEEASNAESSMMIRLNFDKTMIEDVVNKEFVVITEELASSFVYSIHS